MIGINDFCFEFNGFDDLFFFPKLFEQFDHSFQLIFHQFFINVHDIVHLAFKGKIVSDGVNYICKFFPLSKIFNNILSYIGVVDAVEVEIGDINGI